MPNKYWTEDIEDLGDFDKGGSPPPTGSKGTSGTKVREHVRSYRDMGPHQPRDRSGGTARCKVRPQEKGL